MGFVVGDYVSGEARDKIRDLDECGMVFMRVGSKHIRHSYELLAMRMPPAHKRQVRFIFLVASKSRLLLTTGFHHFVNLRHVEIHNVWGDQKTGTYFEFFNIYENNRLLLKQCGGQLEDVQLYFESKFFKKSSEIIKCVINNLHPQKIKRFKLKISIMPINGETMAKMHFAIRKACVEKFVRIEKLELDISLFY